MISLIFFFLAWGSFLNVLAVRLISGTSLLSPSACPECGHRIAWYDNIPVVSWFLLRGTCRTCKSPISVYYPCIELFTLMTMVALWSIIDIPFRYGYFFLFSALIVTFRSDLETMLISRWVSLYLVPAAWLATFLGYFPISILQSVSASIIVPLFLHGLASLFLKTTGRQGMGQGDIDLLALIGATTGFMGAWMSLCMGSLLGSIVGCFYLFITKKGRYTRVPFGPFLSVGTIIYVLSKPYLLALLFPEIY